jgi:flagellar protein FlbD
MIVLHRLGHPKEELFLNSDLIFTVEANPDTVITTTLGNRLVVNESPREVAAAVRDWHATITAQALGRRRRRPARAGGDDRPALVAVDSPPE